MVIRIDTDRCRVIELVLRYERWTCPVRSVTPSSMARAFRGRLWLIPHARLHVRALRSGLDPSPAALLGSTSDDFGKASNRSNPRDTLYWNTCGASAKSAPTTRGVPAHGQGLPERIGRGASPRSCATRRHARHRAKERSMKRKTGRISRKRRRRLP
jgi:hypothetical protein